MPAVTSPAMPSNPLWTKIARSTLTTTTPHATRQHQRMINRRRRRWRCVVDCTGGRSFGASSKLAILDR
jgi:hypothetical protein